MKPTRMAPAESQTSQRPAGSVGVIAVTSAGCFLQGKDRLVRPANSRGDSPAPQTGDSDGSTDVAPRPEQAGAPALPGPSDQLLRARWSKLPGDCADLPNPQRSNWLNMVELALDMVYGPTEEPPSSGMPTS